MKKNQITDIKNLTKISLGIIIGAIICWFIISMVNKFRFNDTIAVSTHQQIVEKVESIGKLELVKMNVRDVMEHKFIRQWLPNASALLIINGEAVGCIDFQQIKPEDIFVKEDSIKIKLPAPELCYCKISHKDSKVYETKNNYFTGIDLVDSAYKAAEEQLKKTVLKSGILEQTKQNAITVLKPFLESLGFKHIEISF